MSPAGALQVGVEAPHPAPCLCRCTKLCKNCAQLCKMYAERCTLTMHKSVQKMCTIVQRYTQRCTCAQCPSSFTPPYTNCEHNYCTQIGIVHNCVHKVHKVVQNVQCTLLCHSQKLSYTYFLRPRPYRRLYMKHGPMSLHCLFIVFDLLLEITFQYALPFSCLAGDDCLKLVLRGNTKVDKFT